TWANLSVGGEIVSRPARQREPSQDTQPARPARQQATNRPSTPLLIGIGAGAGVVLLGLIVTILVLASSGKPKPDSQPVAQEKGREEKRGPPGGGQPPRFVETKPPIGPARVEPGIDHVAFRGHPAAIRSLVLSSDGARAASGGADGTLLVWDLFGRQPLFYHKHTSDLRGPAVSPHSTRVPPSA